MFMVDLAVPRDIDEQVAELADVYLYTVDDLHEVIEENLASRRAAAEEHAYDRDEYAHFRALRLAPADRS